MKKTAHKPSKGPSRYFETQAVQHGFEEYQHRRNGLRVLYVPIPGCGTVTSNIVYLVGSRHEMRGKTGIAHMLEHMLFKDTRDKAGKRQKPRHTILEQKGAIMNATTWDDRTNYYYMMPTEYLDEMLLAEAERMRGIILTDTEFKPEQKNVLSEYEMVSERPEVMLGSALASLLFTSHGYGHDTIGHKTDIERLTCRDLKEFYDTYYWPNNACLVVVGDVDRDTVFSLIERHFGDIPRSPRPIPSLEIVEPEHKGKRTVHIVHESPLALVTYAFRAPKASDQAWAPLQVLLAYLTEGKLSPLYKKLVETHKASSVSGGLMLGHDPHTLSLTATVAKGHSLEEVGAIIESTYKTASTKKISDTVLVRVKNKLLADTLYGRDGTLAIASELTECIAAGDWTLYHSLIARIERVTADDVVACAKEWLSPDTAVIGTFKGTLS